MIDDNSNFINKLTNRWSNRIKNYAVTIVLPEYTFKYSPLKLFLVSEITYGEYSTFQLNKEASNYFDDYKYSSIKKEDIEIKKDILRSLDSGEFKEYWLKYYLIENCEMYGMKFKQDLDKSSTCKRGDLIVEIDGVEIIVEVEKHDKEFLKHNHCVGGEEGKKSKEKYIGLVFALPPKSKSLNLGIPVVYADKDDFMRWYQISLTKKELKDLLILVICELLRREYIQKSIIQAFENLVNKENNECNCVIKQDNSLIKKLTKIGDFLVYENISQSIDKSPSFKEFYKNLTKLIVERI